VSDCRSCGARVTWAKSVTGKWMILDEDPTPAGNVSLSSRGTQYGRLEATVYRNAEAAELAHPGAPRYLDHHVTCPDAEKWRKE
jgi:hypothetical protein